MRQIWFAAVALLMAECDSLPQQRDCSQPTSGYLPPDDLAQSGAPRSERLFSPIASDLAEARLAAELYAVEVGEDPDAVQKNSCFWVRPVAGQRCVYFATRDFSVGGDGTYCFDSSGQKTFEFLGE